MSRIVSAAHFDGDVFKSAVIAFQPDVYHGTDITFCVTVYLGYKTKA